MTKRQKRLLQNWYDSDITSLEGAYVTWSDSKEDAFNYCTGLKEHQGGMFACIPTHNGWQFTYAFIQNRVNAETGVIEIWLWYVSKGRKKLNEEFHIESFYVCDLGTSFWASIRTALDPDYAKLVSDWR